MKNRYQTRATGKHNFFLPSIILQKFHLGSKVWKLPATSTDHENLSSMSYVTRKECLTAKIRWASKVTDNHCHISRKQTIIFWHIRCFKRVIFSCRETKSLYSSITSGLYLKSLICQNISEVEWSPHLCWCNANQNLYMKQMVLPPISISSNPFWISVFLQQWRVLCHRQVTFHNTVFKGRKEDSGKFETLRKIENTKV